MASPIGTNVVTAISRRFIVPDIVDQVYNSNPVFFRLNKANKRIVQGGTQIEVPLMYKRFSAGGSYSGFDVLDVTPSDTVQNGAWDWRQYHVPVVVDGLTMIKVDSPQAIANFIRLQFAQAEMEMAENLASGLWSDGSNTKDIDGLEGAIDDGGVLTTYGGISHSANTFWQAQEDSSTATLSLSALQSHYGNTSEGGRHSTLIASRQEQYNRFWNLQVSQQRYPAAGARDEQLMNAGFDNLLFNGTPWIVDSHVFDGPNTSNSAITFLNEDFIWWAVSPRADFYLEDFQSPVNQDAMVAKMLFAGNVIVTNVARQGKMTAVTG